ncbi:MAG: tRNA pseudouridine(38-40) synthase TruA [Planctomycetota bacterium]
MRRRFRIVLEYDGGGFHGWQAQIGLRTVEGCLREALAPLTDAAAMTAGASRTDAGVHALGQVALAVLETRLDAEELARALAARAPTDLGIVSLEEAADDFHPRHSAIEKRYLYRIVNSPRRPTFSQRHGWWVAPPLSLDAMAEGARAIVGRHDFEAFRNRSKDPPEESVRTIRVTRWDCTEEQVFFQVVGDGFLYRMVRNLVGTLVEVGRGRMEPAAIPEILLSRDRRRAGPSAPPQGLYLMEIAYPDTPLCVLDPRPPLF